MTRIHVSCGQQNMCVNKDWSGFETCCKHYFILCHLLFLSPSSTNNCLFSSMLSMSSVNQVDEFCEGGIILWLTVSQDAIDADNPSNHNPSLKTFSITGSVHLPCTLYTLRNSLPWTEISLLWDLLFIHTYIHTNQDQWIFIAGPTLLMTWCSKKLIYMSFRQMHALFSRFKGLMDVSLASTTQ